MLAVDRVEKPTPNAPGVEQKLPPSPLKFEVADLKLNKTGGRTYESATRAGLRGTHLQLLSMLGFAWDMESAHTATRFIGLPKGVESVYFDINATTERYTNGPAPESLSGFDDDLRGMLRTLLAERFRIQWHYRRPAHGSLLARLRQAEAEESRPGQPRHLSRCPHHPQRSQGRKSDAFATRPCRNATIAQFASILQRTESLQFVYPVEDATGIDGTWDFDLSFTPSWMLNSAKPGAEAAEPSGAVSLGEAINKQLGLRLEKRKRVLPVIVVDHMELTPTEN